MNTTIGNMMKLLAATSEITRCKMLWRIQHVAGDDDARQRLQSLIEFVNTNNPI